MKTRLTLFLGFVALFGTAVLSGRPAVPSTPAQDGTRVVPVAGGISHLLNNRGGNIGVFVGDDGILMVDDLFRETAEDVEQALATLAEGAPVYLINTHWHGDHTGGNVHFGKDATILAHENVRRRLARDESIGGRVSQEELPLHALPTITFEEGLILRFNGETIRLHHMGRAAHTDGDIIVWFTDSKVVHMGDLYFQAGYPYVDTASGGDVRGIIAAAAYVLENADAETKIIPGHGQVTGVAGLREYHEMLETITGRVEELLAENFSIDDMLEAEVSAEFDERWGGAFVNPRRFVESVVASLQRD